MMYLSVSSDIGRHALRHAVRSLLRAPLFSTLVVLTLSLAVGSTAAMFSLADWLFFRPPESVRRPNELRRLYARSHWTVGRVEEIGDLFGFPHFDALRSAMSPRVSLAAYTPPDSFVIGEGDARTYANGSFATADFLPMTGAHVVLGRTFTREEDRMGGGAPVAVISYRLWKSVFDSDPALLGRSVSIARQKLTIIGVLADGFTGIDLTPSDVWVPLADYVPNRRLREPWYLAWRYGQVVRVVTRDSTRRMDDWVAAVGTTTFRQAELAHITRNPDTATILTGPVTAALGPSIRPKLETTIATRLAGIVFVVLIVACANVSTLFSLRGEHRHRELAIRRALGGSRLQVLSAPLLEAATLSACAAIGATIVATWGGGMLARTVVAAGTYRGRVLDWRVGAFTFGLALCATLLAGGIALLFKRLENITATLRTGTRNNSPHGAKFRRGLIVIQAAFSVVLLVGAALFTRSLAQARGIPLGMDTDHMITGRVSFYDPQSHIPSTTAHSQEISSGLRDVAARLAAAPGVRATALASSTPMSEWLMVPVYLENGLAPTMVSDLDPALLVVSRDYFAATGMTVLAGRTFDRSDVVGSEPTVVVNETTARAYWPGESALQKCLFVISKDGQCSRVIGVVRDAHFDAVVEKPMVGIYSAVEQQSGGILATPTILVVRAFPGMKASVAATTRRLLREQFPGAEPPSVTYTSDRVDEGLKAWRLGALLFGMFGTLAIIVSAIGIYSVMAFSVSQRRKDIGLRIALGARPRHIVAFIGLEALRPVALGVMAGVAVSMAFGPLVQDMLFGTSAANPLLLASVAGGTLLVATGATIVPARRAALIDPAIGLRAE